MDPSIRPIQSPATSPARPVARRREGGGTFEVPDERDPAGGDPERDGEDEPGRAAIHADDRPVAPRGEDEAGSHLDVTA